MLSMTKCGKKPIVSSVSISLRIFREQRFLLAFANNIDDQGPRAPLNSIFANQFKCITREKLKVFVLKFAFSGPHPIFLWTQCNSYGQIYHNMAQCQRLRAQMVRHFLVFT